ncbi:MAG: hypothetical protein JRH05_04695 [Deltaproteobacteria bacterium]|nr:hypothetical protein [Deltaproteobacteria bacterium]
MNDEVVHWDSCGEYPRPLVRPLFPRTRPGPCNRRASDGFEDEGEIIEHSFVVLNQGDQPLQISRVRPG